MDMILIELLRFMNYALMFQKKIMQNLSKWTELTIKSLAFKSPLVLSINSKHNL